MNSYTGYNFGSGWVNTLSSGWLVGLGAALLMCALAGAMVHGWWLRRQARERRRIPKRWPLSPRVLANSEERRVWRWLARAFFDHHVMIKIPVTRFTLPRSKEHGLHWYELLSGVYCTFTVCGSDGHVIGCIDVPGRFGLARKNRVLKQTLLNQCGIAYMVVESNNLPRLPDIRTEFLGEMASMTRDRDRDEAAIAAARTNLRASLMRQRQTRNSDLSPLAANSSGAYDSRSFGDTGTGNSRFSSTQWQQDNSFLVPLDSRKSELR
jgi:Protein of unknown function (DUF2726)